MVSIFYLPPPPKETGVLDIGLQWFDAVGICGHAYSIPENVC